MPAPKVDVLGKYAGSTVQTGRQIQAEHRPVVGINMGHFVETFDRTVRYLAEKSNELSPEERADRIQMQRNMNARLAQIGSEYRYDPDTFVAQAQKEKDKWLKNVNDRHKAWFNEQWESSINGFSSTINANKLKQDYDRQEETFLSRSDELRTKAMNAISHGDMATYAQLTAEWQANENYMYDKGFMGIEKKISRNKDYIDTGLIQQNLGIARSMFNSPENLNSYLKKVEKSSQYSPEQKRSIKNNILSEYNTHLAERRVANAGIVSQANFGIEAYKMGIEPQGFDFDDTMAKLKNAGETEKAAQLQAIYDLKNDMAGFTQLAPAQMATTLDDMKKSAKSQEDLARIKIFEQAGQNAVKEIEADPLNYAIGHNIVKDAGLDLTKPETFDLRQRNGEIVREKYGLDYTPIMTKSEVKAISNSLQKADSNQKAAMVATISNAFGENADNIFGQIAPKNPELAIAGKIFKQRPDVAASIIEGKNIADNESGFAPQKNMDLYNAFGELDEALSNFSTEDVAAVKQAVLAQTTYLNKKNNIFADGDADTEDKLDEDRFKQAISDVLGGKIERVKHASQWFGGSYNVVLPENTSRNNFEDWVENLKDSDIGKAYLGDYSVTAQDVKDKGQLKYNDDDTYTVTINGVPVVKADGNPLVLIYGGR